MREILLIAKQELVVNLRRPGFIIMTLLVPALGVMVLAVASVFGGQVGTFLESQFTPGSETIGYVDQSDLTDVALPQYSGEFQPYTDEASARADLLAGEIGSYFILSSDYLQTGEVTVYSTGGGFAALAVADNGEMRDFLVDHLLVGKVDAETQARVREPMDIKSATLDESGEASTESPFSWAGDFVIPYLFSILFMITIFTASGFLLQSVSEEKEGRTIEILLSSISPSQLLAGKILGLGALGLIQVLVWVGAGMLLTVGAVTLLSVTDVITIRPSTVALGIAYFILGYLLFATLMAVAGSMGTTMRESQQLAGIFTMSAAIPWMTMGIVLANPDSPVAIVLSYFPLTAPVMMLIRLGFGQVPAGQIIISLAILIIAIGFSLWAGAKLFRVGLLMYGKRPSLKELAQAFRQA